MQTCQAYQSCPVCTHAWSPPLNRGCVADGYRRFLEMGDPGRQRKVKYKGLSYEYKDVCVRKVPKTRDTEFVQSVCAVVTKNKPWLGHKFICTNSLSFAGFRLATHLWSTRSDAWYVLIYNLCL